MQHHKHPELLAQQVNKIAFYFPNFFNLCKPTLMERAELARLEKDCIAWFKPPLNVRLRSLPEEHWKFRKAEDLIAQSPIWECITSEHYYENSPQVKKFYSWAVENKLEVWNVLELAVTQKPIGTLHNFLKKLQYETERVGYFTIGGQQKRHYKIINPNLPCLEAINGTECQGVATSNAIKNRN